MTRTNDGAAQVSSRDKDFGPESSRGVKPEDDPDVEVVNKERRVVSGTKQAFGVLSENARLGPQPSLEPRGVKDENQRRL